MDSRSTGFPARLARRANVAISPKHLATSAAAQSVIPSHRCHAAAARFTWAAKTQLPGSNLAGRVSGSGWMVR